MTLARITGSTFRGGLLRGVVAGAVAVLVVYGVLALTSGEQTATAQEPCARGTAVPNPAANPGLVSDCAVLLAVKDALRGTGTLNWSADAALSTWGGVTVDGEPPRVVSLDLEGAGLNGTIPARLGELAALRTLALQDNALTGTIPARLGDLERLERLRLQGNALTGAIPAELGSLAALQLLYLQGNQLTGEIPRALAALANLVALDLNSNRLTGSIPAELGELWSLRDLYLEHNQLSGQIPEVLEDRSLRSLYLAGNRGLTGCLPQGLRGVAFTDVTALGLPACAPRPAFTLTTSVTSGGTITPAPGRHTYGRNARVRVRATAAGWDIELQSWGGACARTPLTETDCIVTMDADKTVSVAFERAVHTLTVEATAGGSVTPEGTTTHFARRDVAVTVTATPDPGYRVASWGGDCSASGANLTCEVTMDGDRTVSVAFEEGTAYALTVTAGANGDVSPAPGTSTHHEDAQVTLTAAPDAGYRVASWGGDCTASGTNLTCVLTMDGDRTAAVTFEQGTAYPLTTTAGEGGSITPAGTTTHHDGAAVTLRASWNDATHTFSRWGGDCSGTASTCVLTMDAARTVTATFAALPADRCATTTATDCIRAVYRGAPGDYAQVQDIPAGVLLTPSSDGRYYAERGRQYTVVTAAPLPEGWTRFYLRTPLGTPAPVSASQLIPPVGTTFTFTVSDHEAASTLITFDLKEARPFVRPRPDGKPEIGDTVVSTTFQVVNCQSGVAVPTPTTNTGLVEDCKSLLKAKDRLAGTAILNWSAGRPMSQWTGITVAGTPQRVTKLELASSALTGELTGLLGNLTALTHLRLDGNALTGRIPSKLQLLTALTHLYLGGNALTGCLPPPLRTVTNNDLGALNLPGCAPPERVHEHRDLIDLEGGQAVSYQLYEDGPTLTVDLPAGYTYRMRSVTGEPPPGLPSRLIIVSIFNEGQRSWISLDPDSGREYYRYIQGWGGLTHDGRRVGVPVTGDGRGDSDPPDSLIEVFNTIADSAWVQE